MQKLHITSDKKLRHYLIYPYNTNIGYIELNFLLYHTWKLKTQRNGISANRFLYSDDGRISEELFTPTLNGIAISVWCVLFYVPG